MIPHRQYCLLLVLLTAVVVNAQPPVFLTGTVVDGVTNSPIPGATIQNDTQMVSTNEDGNFILELHPDEDSLQISADNYLETTVPLNLPIGSTELEVLLFPNTFAETVQVVSPVPTSERPSSTPIEAEEVFQAAGSLDNIFRTLSTLPGIASTGDFGSRLAVRGGTPDQNLTVMDGVEIHNPYRLFGLVGAFNPETVDRFELTAGGFGAAYGDRLSSLLLVDNRIGRRDFEGSSSVSITDTNVVAEGGTFGSGSWLISGRRTYYDIIAGFFTEQNLPSFNDLQLHGNWEIGPGKQLSVFALSSRENTNFVLDSANSDSRNAGNFSALAGNNLVSVQFEASLGSSATSRTVTSWYRNTDQLAVNATFGSSSRRSNFPDDEIAEGVRDIIFDRKLLVRDFSIRQEFTLQLSAQHTIETGVEIHNLGSGVGLSISGDRNETVANPSSIRGGSGLPNQLNSSLAGTRGGAWVQDHYEPNSTISVDPGLRIDWSTINGDVTVSPRLAATIKLNKTSRLRLAAGLYTQSPGYEKLIQSDYFFDLSQEFIVNLRHERSTHLVGGFERDLGENQLLRVEGYYKTYNDLIVGRLESNAARLKRVAQYNFPNELQRSVPQEAQITSVPTNGGRGRSYGIDAYLVRNKVDARLKGWLSYAWGRADRETYNFRYPFEYDRRHAFNAVGQYRLGEQWSIATTAQLATGFPYTPAVGLKVAADEQIDGRLKPARDASGALVYAIDFGTLNNLQKGRLPHYARVDLRVTHQPGGPGGRWLWFVEVINAFKRDNPVELETALAYNPGGLTPLIVENPTAGFPLLPSFGVRVRF